MLRSHKIRLYPNDRQATYFRRACGIRRLGYNWALWTSRQLYEQGVKTSGYDLVKLFNSIKAEQFPYTNQVSKWAPQKAIQDAWDAYKNWWSGKAQAPRFKRKNKARDSFYLGANCFSITSTHFRVPKLGQVRTAQPLRFSGVPKFATISKTADQWFVAITVETLDPYPHRCKTQAAVGLDLGIDRLVTTSEGQYIKNPRNLIRKERKLKRLHQSVSRKQPGSNNRAKAKLRLARVYSEVKNARLDLLHRVTTDLVKRHRIIGIEDLNVSGMLQNHCLARHIQDASFREIRRQLEYKAKLANSSVVVVDRWFPSSKLCSTCSKRHPDLKLSDRTFCCPGCGLQINRDVNAAINIKREAERLNDLAVRHTAVKACREDIRLNSADAEQQPQRSRNRAADLTG